MSNDKKNTVLEKNLEEICEHVKISRLSVPSINVYSCTYKSYCKDAIPISSLYLCMKTYGILHHETK